MESGTLQTSLRVLYTVNNNPQYILAKSSSQVPAIVCSEAATHHQASYARAPLKACLSAVCDSSPELLQDPSRDFSLYVLDPLESQPLPTSLATPHNTGSPRGVAVALGLMSWALESNDSTNVLVTGTIVPNASPSLEVVFALRETKRMPKPTFYSYSPLAPISAPGPSQPPNLPHPAQDTATGWLPTSHFHQQQQTLTRSADFPELYIGPPRRAPGRPEGSTSSKAKMKSQAGTSSLPRAGSSKVVETRSEFKQEAGRSSKQKTKHRPPRPPPFTCGPLTRHTTTMPETSATGVPQQFRLFDQNQTQSHPQTQPYFNTTHNPLIGLLSTIAIASTSSSNLAANTSPEQQAALLAALQKLLVTNPYLLQLAAMNTEHPVSSLEQTGESKLTALGSKADDEQDDTDSDVVVLDSSTIDITAFRKPGHRQLGASNDTSLTINQESPMPSIQSMDSSPLPASTPPSRQESTPASSQTTIVISEAELPILKRVYSEQTAKGNVIPSHVLEMPTTPSPSRKRKLDEFIQSEAHSTPASPPSPSPMGRMKSVSSPSVRLPSLLGALRSLATSGSHLQAGSSGSLANGNPVTFPANKNGNQPTSDASTSKVVHSGNKSIATDTTLLKRKRTLNEVMEEREARKNAKVRKQPISGRKMEVQVSAKESRVVPSRSIKMESALRCVQSSPPRPLFRSESVASLLPTSTYQSSSIPAAVVSNPPMIMSASTAPSASTSTAAPVKNPLKNFIMPAWARTSTAMLPRLSEEALARQQAEQEAKKAQVSLRRREAAKAKRRRLRAAERTSKESSDGDEDAVAKDAEPWTLQSSPSGARSALLLPPPQPSLPVFASDVVEPILSSPPRSYGQPVPPVIPSTPPRKRIPFSSASYCTPSKPGSCSLFTPSGKDQGSLFTPSTPSVTRSLARVTFTPRSPTALHGAKKSPRKSVPQTPRRNCAHHQTPSSLCSCRTVSFRSPGLVVRTSQTQTGMGTRTFLLPPPSPSTSRTPRVQNRVRSKVPEGSTPIARVDSGIMERISPSDKGKVDQQGSLKEDRSSCEPDGVLPGGDKSIPPTQCSPVHLTVDGNQGTWDLSNVTSMGDTPQAREDHFSSSPLPPSSPPPASPVSSPAKRHDSDCETPIIDSLVVPDCDILLPSASDSDGRPQEVVDTAWLSDDTRAASWLTETEAWLTDTEGGGGPLLTDSDGAWLSDSDAVFGDMSSLPPSSASNWLSDDADVDTDAEDGGVGCEDGAFDTAAFERAFATLVERGGQSIVGKDEGAASGTTHSSMKEVESEFWAAIRPLLGGTALNDAAAGDVHDRADVVKVEQDVQELLDSLVGV